MHGRHAYYLGDACACACVTSSATISYDVYHRSKEDQYDQRKRHHHPHALEVTPFYDLVVGLEIRVAELRALPNRPQLAVAVARS